MRRSNRCHAAIRPSFAVLLRCAALLTGVSLITAAASNAGADPVPDSSVVATVADRGITVGDVRLAYELGEGLDRSRSDAELKRDILDLLINRKVLVLEAERRRLLRTGALTRYVREIELKLAGNELRERIFAGKIDISEEEVEEIYERYFYTYHAHHLSVDTRSQADEIHGRLRSGESFADLARRYSEDHESAKRGGDLGEKGAGTLIIEFEDAVFKLGAGEMTAVIKGKGEHYKIFKLESIRRDREPELTLDEMRPYLEQRVKTRESGAAKYTWELSLFDKYEFRLLEENYTRFADHLRDNIAVWEAVSSFEPDSLTPGWMFSHWDRELRTMELVRMKGNRVTVDEFLKIAREMPGCPTCLWRDSDVQLRQQVKGISFDKMYEMELREIRAEKLPWIEQELMRRREDRLVDMMTALLAVKPESISDEEAKAYFEQMDERPQVPAKAKARRIVLETEDQAWDIWERLQGGADFRALAERFSTDKRTNYRGGETDFFGPNTLEGMANVALEHEPGDMIQPFQTSRGWEVVLVLEKIPARPATFVEARGSAKRVVARDRTREAVVGITAERRAATQVEIDQQLLDRMALVGS